MAHPQTEALIRRYFEALEAGDVDGVLACVTENMAHDINQGGERRIGKHRFHAYLARSAHHYKEAYAALTILMNEDGTRAAAEYNVTGTYLQTEDGLPPAHGQTYALPAATFFVIEAGLISRVTQYYNLTDWITQITAMPS